MSRTGKSLPNSKLYSSRSSSSVHQYFKPKQYDHVEETKAGDHENSRGSGDFESFLNVQSQDTHSMALKRQVQNLSVDKVSTSSPSGSETSISSGELRDLLGDFKAPVNLDLTGIGSTSRVSLTSGEDNEILYNIQDAMKNIEHKTGKLYLVRFYNKDRTMNSRMSQMTSVQSEPMNHPSLIQRAFNHMYKGHTDDNTPSPFVSFTASPVDLLQSLNSPDRSRIVEAIVKGSQGVGSIVSSPPASHYGIFELDLEKCVTWEDVSHYIKLTGESVNPDRKHFEKEKEIVYFSPNSTLTPVAEFFNPYRKNYSG